MQRARNDTRAMHTFESRSPIRLARGASVLLWLLALACGSEPAGDSAGVAALWAGSPPEGRVDEASERAADRPSVVMITIDTLRRDHLSLYGYDRETSPGLEFLEGELVIFDHAVATSPWTMPSTASLFSGLYPSGHGGHGKRRIREDVPLLAEAFAAAGYRTAAISGNPYVSSLYGLERGFQDFAFLGGAKAMAYRDIREILSSAEAWLDENSAVPFFLYLHVMNVHGPYRAPEAYRARFVDGPTVPFEFRSELWRDIVRRDRTERRADVSEAQLRDITARYDGAIAYTDSQLEEFVDGLRARGLLDDSILVVTSDHGEEFFEHGSFGHRHALHPELLDIPLLIRLPGGERGGTRIAQPVSLIDVPATVLDLAGLLEGRAEGKFGAGRSLAPLLEAQTEPPRALMAELARQKGSGTMVQLGRHRLIRLEGESEPSLYRADGGAWQRVDRVADTAALIEQLTAAERALLAEAGGHSGETIADSEEGTLREQLDALGYIEGKD